MLIRPGRRVAVAPFFAALLLLAAGCPFGPSPDGNHRCVKIGTDGDTPPSSSKPFIWLGTNDGGGYREIKPNETLSVRYGAQGGEHIWGAARLYAPQGGSWTLTFQITGPDGAKVAAFKDLVDTCSGELAEASQVTVRFQGSPTSVSTGTMAVDATPDGGKTTVHAEAPIAWK